jgi:transcriptional regulator with XRE-family HTH domain
MAKAKKSSAGEPPAAEMAALKLGELIRAKRKARTWTQADLGDRLGMHRAYVSQIETGKKGWPQSYIGKIALALDMRPSELGRAAGWIVRDDEYDPETGEPVPGSPVRRGARGFSQPRPRPEEIIAGLRPSDQAALLRFAAFLRWQAEGGAVSDAEELIDPALRLAILRLPPGEQAMLLGHVRRMLKESASRRPAPATERADVE